MRLQTLRYEAGSISQLDLSQAQAELAATEATIPVFERQMRQTENLMAILLGRIGGSVARGENGDPIDVIKALPERTQRLLGYRSYDPTPYYRSGRLWLKDFDAITVDS